MCIYLYHISDCEVSSVTHTILKNPIPCSHHLSMITCEPGYSGIGNYLKGGKLELFYFQNNAFSE